MSATARLRPGLAFGAPLGLLLLLAGVIGLQTGLLTLPPAAPVPPGLRPETVTLQPRAYSTRAAGTFMREDGAILDPPLVAVAAPPPPLVVMTHEVSVADYARCVNEGACRPADLRPGTRAAKLPVTGVSFDDATAYARWLSNRTGEPWRLPTLAEWDFAAGSLAPDEALGIAAETDNPALRWIATYEQEAAFGGARIDPLPLGSGGVNELGVADLAGAVWEWTLTCSGRTTVDAAGGVIRTLDSCGAHYLAGRHRTVMSDFIRDAATGGCATGRPPDNLGFRLVQGAPRSPFAPLLRLFGG